MKTHSWQGQSFQGPVVSTFFVCGVLFKPCLTQHSCTSPPPPRVFLCFTWASFPLGLQIHADHLSLAHPLTACPFLDPQLLSCEFSLCLSLFMKVPGLDPVALTPIPSRVRAPWLALPLPWQPITLPQSCTQSRVSPMILVQLCSLRKRRHPCEVNPQRG